MSCHDISTCHGHVSHWCNLVMLWKKKRINPNINKWLVGKCMALESRGLTPLTHTLRCWHQCIDIWPHHVHILWSRVSPFIYWSANYVWDYVNYLIPGFLCIAVLGIFNVQETLGDAAGNTHATIISRVGWDGGHIKWAARVTGGNRRKRQSDSYIGWGICGNSYATRSFISCDCD